MTIVSGTVRRRLSFPADAWEAIEAYAKADNRTPQNLLLHAVLGHMSRLKKGPNKAAKTRAGSFRVQGVESPSLVQARGPETAQEGSPA